MDSDQTPINSTPIRTRGRFGSLGGLALGFEERVLWRLGDGFRGLARAGRHSFEWLRWAVRRYLVWPLADGFAMLSGPGRVLAVAGAAIAVVAVGAGVYIAAGSSGSGEPAAATVASVRSEHAPAPPSTPPARRAEPTLQGAAPVFAPTKGKAAEVGAPKSTDGGGTGSKGTSASPPASAATGTISSRPSKAPGSVGAEISAIPGKPAGARAVAVARKFSSAFVVYETRGRESEVRKTFAATATPELAKALLKRPPRQPADVSVPRAKVLNIVPGPSRGGVYTVSVSLLRVGVTSELRLELEKLKDEGWRVTNVLG